MRRRRTRLGILALAWLVGAPGTGCHSLFGTFSGDSDFQGEPYAGTRAFFHEWPALGPRVMGPALPFAIFYNLLAPLDLPLTLVLDTALLPFTSMAALVRRAASSDRPRPGSTSPGEPSARVAWDRAIALTGEIVRIHVWATTGVPPGTPVEIEIYHAAGGVGERPVAVLGGSIQGDGRLVVEWPCGDTPTRPGYRFVVKLAGLEIESSWTLRVAAR